MRIALITALIVITVASLFYAVDRNLLLKRANAKIDRLLENEEAARNRIARLSEDLEWSRSQHAETNSPPDAPVPSDQLVYFIAPEVTVGERGQPNYFFKHLIGSNGQVLAEDAHFRQLHGFATFAFKTPHGTRYYNVDDLDPLVVKSLGFDVDTIKRRIADDVARRQMQAAQLKFQQELRHKAAEEFALRETALAEQAKAEAALRDAAARERLAQIAEANAQAQQRPPDVRVKVITVPYQEPEEPENPGQPE